MKKNYKVTTWVRTYFDAYRRDEKTFTIEARCIEEAMDIVYEIVKENRDWEVEEL